MSSATNIEWTDKTWNPVVGCSRVSSGCDHCYAVRMTRRLEGAAIGAIGNGALRRAASLYLGLTVLNKKLDRHFNGTVRCLPERLTDPLHWRKPCRVFVNSMSDLFHESIYGQKVPWETGEFNAAGFEFLLALWETMRQTPRHTYHILTKRPHVMADLVWRITAKMNLTSPLENVWLGTSIESAEHWARAAALARSPAANRFWSLEPLLGDLGVLPIRQSAIDNRKSVDWVIVGGESGPGGEAHAPGLGSLYPRSVPGRRRAVLFQAVGGVDYEW